jgi:quinol monooxygenase YgiN
MPTITKTDRLATVINVFTVTPDQQPHLVELLAKVTESTVRHVPGFVSAALHRSLDGTKVTMYAQWRSVEAYGQMRGNPQTSPLLDEALRIARFEPGVYEVVDTFAP